jgi:NADH dehydrogenase
VAKVYGVHFSGVLAWAMWRMIYWAKIPQSSQRVRILLDWTLDVIFGRNAVELPFEERPVHEPTLPEAASDIRNIPRPKRTT